MDKKYLINICIYVLSGLIALLLIGYVVFHLSGSGEQTLSTAIARRITAGQTIHAKGYLFLDEMPLTSDGASGSIYSALKEGENVIKGSAVGSVYNDPEELLPMIRRYDEIIHLLEEGNKKEQLDVIELRLKELSKTLRENDRTGTLSNAAQIEQLQILLQQRQVATGVQKGYDQEITQLKELRAQLLSRLGSAQKKIYTPYAGNFYAKTDGYETLFSREAAESLDIESFLALTQREPQSFEGKNVIGKIRESAVWYTALYTDNASAMDLTEGQVYSLQFKDKGNFEMTLYRVIVSPERDGTLLIFRSDSVTPAGLLSRTETVSFEINKTEGLMVPTGAVRYFKNEETGESYPGVYVSRGNKLAFKRIEILSGSDQGYYLVKEMDPSDKNAGMYLALNDVIVTSGKDLKEGYRV